MENKVPWFIRHFINTKVIPPPVEILRQASDKNVFFSSNGYYGEI